MTQVRLNQLEQCNNLPFKLFTDFFFDYIRTRSGLDRAIFWISSLTLVHPSHRDGVENGYSR
jgi:hypothetical protein